MIETSRNDYVTVGFWKRLLALLIDGILCLPWGIFVTLLQYNKFRGYILITVFGSIVYILYNVFFVYKFGGTIGKLLLRLQVLDYNYEKLSLFKSLRRFSPYIVSESLIRLSSIIIIMFSITHWNRMNILEINKIIQGNMLYIIIILLLTIWVAGEIISLTIDINDRTLHDKFAESVVVKRVINH